ncbi:GNAT family N-acetyltransferase [Microbacterium aurantiacum]|uniref:N-acetyltransferase n=1 Tax=Microbacterium aurantiacum TaxID=162393 RepID=A0ABT8FWY4_9MICO|nr:GNAT family N-acetyltransferase [Microbacterium aurantiacum]MDN4465627.1 N-acetyltransferase [Microbacterium aurantiacum]
MSRRSTAWYSTTCMDNGVPEWADEDSALTLTALGGAQSPLGDAVAFTRSFTNPPYRGNGLAGEVVAYAVDDVEANSSQHIVPACWYVGEWFDHHPDRRHLLDPRTT